MKRGKKAREHTVFAKHNQEFGSIPYLYYIKNLPCFFPLALISNVQHHYLVREKFLIYGVKVGSETTCINH